MKRGRQGETLPPEMIEAIKQMYIARPNKAFIARELGLNYSTVCRHLGHEDPEEVREKRREAMGRLASKLSRNAEALVDDLTEVPDNATWNNKAIVMGITVDKLEKMDRRLDDQYKDDKAETGENVLPHNVEQLAGMVRNDLKQLAGLIGLDLAPKRDGVMEIKEQVEVVEAEVTKVEDLYPEGRSDA